jgi:hypothetical protein
VELTKPEWEPLDVHLEEEKGLISLITRGFILEWRYHINPTNLRIIPFPGIYKTLREFII